MSSAAATHPAPDLTAEHRPMKGPVTKSLIFHAIIIILSIVGIPYLHHEIPPMIEPLSVELAKPDEVTKATAPPAHVQHQAPLQVDKPPPTPPQPMMPAPAPPKPVAPEKPPDEVAMPVKKPVVKLPPKPLDKKPPPKDKPKDQQQAFQSVLKNLIAPDDANPSHDKTDDKSDKKSSEAPTAPAMTSNEFANLQRQLAGCWSVIAGARMAEDLVVDVKLVMNWDRTVRSKEVVDQFSYNSNSYFRAAADSALRAVEDPHCNPLDLPPDKYDQWKVITVTFDPKEML